MDGPGGAGSKGREMPGSPQRGQGEFAAGRAAGIPMPSVPDDTPMMVLGGVVVVVLFIIWIYIQLNPPERRRFLSVPTTKQVDLTSQKGRDHVRRSLTEPDGPYAKISDKEVRMAVPFHTVNFPPKKAILPSLSPTIHRFREAPPQLLQSCGWMCARFCILVVFECITVHVQRPPALQSRRFAFSRF